MIQNIITTYDEIITTYFKNLKDVENSRLNILRKEK